MTNGDVNERIDRIEERWAAERSRWMQRDVELKRFVDEITRRHVLITQEAIGALQMLQAEIADQRDEIKANTQAVLRLLDERFGPQPPQG